MSMCFKINSLASKLFVLGIFGILSASKSQPSHSPNNFYKDLDVSMYNSILNIINPPSAFPYVFNAKDFSLSSGMNERLSEYVKDISEAYSNDARNCKIKKNSLSSIYFDFLNNARFSSSLLSSEEYSRLGEIRAYLFDSNNEPIFEYANFLKYKNILESVRGRIEKIPPIERTPIQNLELRQATEDLLLKGEEGRFRNIHNELIYLTRLEKNNRKSIYLKTYTDNSSDSRSVESVGWSEYEKSAPYSKGNIILNLEGPRPRWVSQNVGINFEWSIIQIKRPWLNPELFTDDSFKSKEILSDGAGGGILGSYINSILAIRNIEIEIKDIDEYKKTLDYLGRNNSDLHFGFVPIYTRNSGPAVSIIGNRAIKYSGTIIIACQPKNFPKSPNPNPSFFW